MVLEVRGLNVIIGDSLVAWRRNVTTRSRRLSASAWNPEATTAAALRKATSTISSSAPDDEIMPHDLEILAEFSLDSWLLAGSTHDTCMSPVDGRAWERAIGDLLRRAPLPNRQRAGLTTLFGVQAASGVAHELDACAAGGGTLMVVECKSQTSGVTKADAALFHEKTLDFFCAKPARFRNGRWWRVVASSTPVSDSVRAFCVSLGLVLTEPNHLPLSVVLRVASRPGADMHLREALLQDAVRLAERALVPLQDKWRYDAQAEEIRFQPTTLSPNEIQDLLWLQEELGSNIPETPIAIQCASPHACGKMFNHHLERIVQSPRVSKIDDRVSGQFHDSAGGNLVFVC